MARSVTQKFCRLYRKALDKLKLRLYLNKLYVDDQNCAARAVSREVSLERHKDGTLYLSSSSSSFSSSSLSSTWNQDSHTAAVYRQVADTILRRSITMKEDVASNHSDKKLPILDMAMWATGSKILHQLYTKPMASRAVIMARSAFTDREKKNILVEEGNRRLRNCHPDLPWLRKAAFLTDMNLAMRKAVHT